MREGGKSGIYAVLLVAGAAWGLSTPVQKVMVSTGHPPLGLIFWQFVFGAVALALVILVRAPRAGEAAGGRALRRLAPRRDRLGYCAAIAVIGTLAPSMAGLIAARELPAGVMGLNIATVPMFALAIAAALGVERASPRRLLGVAFGAVAVLLLIGPEASLPNPEAAPFVLLALFAPLCYGFEGSYIALRAPPDLDPIETLYGAFLVGAAATFPIVVAFGVWVDLFRPWGAAEAAILGVAVLHAGAYTGYVWLVGRAGPVFSSQIAYLVTLFAILFSMTLLGERYSAWVWVSVVAMFCGLALVQPRRAAAAAG